MTLPFSNATHVGVIEAGAEKTLPIAELGRRLGVNALIRLQPDDFAQLDRTSRHWVHFNLEATLNQPGLRYAVLPILRQGHRRDDGQEVLPVIDPTQRRLGLCTAVFQRVPVDHVTTEQFAHSLPTIRTPDALRAALVHRYGRMFPRLSEAEIVARGCAVTHLLFDEDP